MKVQDEGYTITGIPHFRAIRVNPDERDGAQIQLDDGRDMPAYTIDEIRELIDALNTAAQLAYDMAGS